MCELGGVWIQSKAIIPLIAPPFGFADLKAVLAGVQALKINNGTDLDTMRDDVTAIYDAKALSKTSRWTIRKDKFLEKLEAVIAQLPDNNPIEKLEHEKVLSKLHDYKVEVDEQQAEIDVLKEKIGRLMLVKDATQAADVIAEYTDAHSRFEDLLSECKQAFKPFSTLILKTIFESFNGKDYIPKSGDEWDEAREGINEGLLIENSEDNGVKPNESDTDILEAIEKLGYLRQFLSEGDEEFSAWYSNTFKGVTDNIRVKPFWRKHLVDDRAFWIDEATSRMKRPCCHVQAALAAGAAREALRRHGKAGHKVGGAKHTPVGVPFLTRIPVAGD